MITSKYCITISFIEDVRELDHKNTKKESLYLSPFEKSGNSAIILLYTPFHPIVNIGVNGGNLTLRSFSENLKIPSMFWLTKSKIRLLSFWLQICVF